MRSIPVFALNRCCSVVAKSTWIIFYSSINELSRGQKCCHREAFKMTSQGNCIYLISDTIILPVMVKSCITWDKWKNITCTKRILWWNHWTLTIECTFLLQHGIGISSLIDYLLGPQSCENKNLDVILSHNHCLPWILLQRWYKDIHIDKMKNMGRVHGETVFLLLSRCQPWDAV